MVCRPPPLVEIPGYDDPGICDKHNFWLRLSTAFAVSCALKRDNYKQLFFAFFSQMCFTFQN